MVFRGNIFWGVLKGFRRFCNAFHLNFESVHLEPRVHLKPQVAQYLFLQAKEGYALCSRSTIS